MLISKDDTLGIDDNLGVENCFVLDERESVYGYVCIYVYTFVVLNIAYQSHRGTVTNHETNL